MTTFVLSSSRPVPVIVDDVPEQTVARLSSTRISIVLSAEARTVIVWVPLNDRSAYGALIEIEVQRHRGGQHDDDGAAERRYEPWLATPGQELEPADLLPAPARPLEGRAQHSLGQSPRSFLEPRADRRVEPLVGGHQAVLFSAIAGCRASAWRAARIASVA